MPKNFFKNLFHSKKISNKENIDIADRFNRQVTFRQSHFEPGHKYSYDVDLSNPTAPYHTKTAPKRRKGPRSCPGGPGQDYDDDASQNSGDLNRSFGAQSEFVTSSRPSKSARRRNQYTRTRDDDDGSTLVGETQRQPFGQPNNGNVYANGSRMDRTRYQDGNESMDSSSNGGDWELSKEHVKKMQQQVDKYQKKLVKAINRERFARQELEQEKNRRLQTESRLHSKIYELEEEVKRLRTCLEYEQGQRRMNQMSYPSFEHAGSRFMPPPMLMTNTFMNSATTSSVATVDGAGEHLASRSNMPFLLNLETPDETKVFRQNDSDVLSQRPAGTPLMANISTSSVDFERPRASSSKVSSSSILTLTHKKPPFLFDDGYGTASVHDDSMSMQSASSKNVSKKLRRSLSATTL